MARAVAAVLFLAAALAVSSADAATTLRRHRVAGPSGGESMASEDGVLVNGNAAAPKDARDGYGISAGMGDWLSTPSHRRGAHHAAAAAAPAQQRFAQQHKPLHGAAGGADALLPLVAPGNAYSTPRATNTERELNAQNTPIARDLPAEPTPLLQSGAGAGAEGAAPASEQPMPPPAPKRVAKAAGAAAAAHHKAQHQHKPRGGAGTVESAGAYEMPTQFAGTTVSRDTNSRRDPDAFFHMTSADTHASQAGARAEHSAAMGKPLYATGEGAAQFDTIDKWQTELAAKAKVNALHKQLLAKAHGKPLPPPKPHKPSARFLQRLAKQKKAQAKAKAKAEAQAKVQAEAQAAAEAAAKAEADAAAAKAAPAPASELDADAQEFVSFARAMGENDIDPVKHSARIARAAQLVRDDRLARDARFQQLKAAEQRARKAKADRKRRAKRAAQLKRERERVALARELARVKAERVALAAEKKRVAAERRKLAAVAKLKANALKAARAKLKAQKLKAEKAEAEHASAIPSHLLAGAVPLPPAAPAAAPAAPKPTAAAVAANPFLQYSTAPAAPAGPPAPAAAAAPAVVSAAKPVPAAAVPAPTVRPAAPPAPAPVAAQKPAAPALSAEELAMANYVGDKPVIFAASNDDAVVRNPLPPPGPAPRVEYIAPTPLSQLPTAEYIPHSAADNRDASKLVIAADTDAHSGSNAAAEDTGTTTYGSADDLLQGGEALLQTGSTAKATAHAQAAASKWPHASKGAPGGDDKTGGAAPKLNPVLSCILANCSVPYLSCLSSMSCSAVFDCLQSTNAPIVHCARFHARMGEKDKRLFAELSDCEQREQCFGPQHTDDQSQSEPVTSASTDGGAVPPAPTAASPAPATAAPAKPVAPAAAADPKPSPAVPRPHSCELLCTRKCAGVADGADKCLRSCSAACFKKRYVV